MAAIPPKDICTTDLKESVRQRIFDRVAVRWNRIHRRGFFGVLSSAFYGSRRLKAIFVVEQEDRHTDISCAGKAIGAWRYDHEGLKRFEGGDNLNPEPVYGHLLLGSIWEKQIWRFFIAPDNGSVIIEEEDGPGSVWISHLSVVVQGNQTYLKHENGFMRDKLPRNLWNIIALSCRSTIVLAIGLGVCFLIAVLCVAVKSLWR